MSKVRTGIQNLILEAAAQEAAWRSPGEAAIAILDGRRESRCADFTVRVHRHDSTIAKVDGRCASRPCDSPTRVRRSKTAIEQVPETVEIDQPRQQKGLHSELPSQQKGLSVTFVPLAK